MAYRDWQFIYLPNQTAFIAYLTIEKVLLMGFQIARKKSCFIQRKPKERS